MVAAAPVRKNMIVEGEGSPPKFPVPPASASMIPSALLENVIPRLGPGPLPVPPVPPL